VARGSRLIIQRGMVMRSVSTDPSSMPLYRLPSPESEASRLSLRCDRPVKHV
jgi:hypothetical protein